MQLKDIPCGGGVLTSIPLAKQTKKYKKKNKNLLAASEAVNLISLNESILPHQLYL